MSAINAQTVNCVNAYSGTLVPHTFGMGRKAESPPSRFWVRLTEALADEGLATSQNGIANLLKMSQGSVGRWYHNEGLPELETCIELAILGKVTVDWLLTGRKPKYPISKNPLVRELVEICEDLKDDEAKDRVLRSARGELLQQQASEMQAADTARRKA